MSITWRIISAAILAGIIAGVLIPNTIENDPLRIFLGFSTVFLIALFFSKDRFKTKKERENNN